MPRNAVIARRYVRALSVLNEDKADTSTPAKVLLELKGFQSVINASRDLREFFLSPVIGRDEKKEALQDLKEKLPLTTKFLSTLVESNRLSSLNEIVEEFENSLEALSGELSVELQMAHNLSASTLEEIKQTLEERWKKKIKIKTVINPELIGGFVAKAPGKILDASVANQFQLLKQSLGTR